MKNSKERIQELTQKGFLKTTRSSAELTSEEKAKLNLRGNQLLNEGNWKQAQKIFLTTCYSDGLCRIGDVYREQNDDINALKFYILSGRKDKSEPLTEVAVRIVRCFLDEQNEEEK